MRSGASLGITALIWEAVGRAAIFNFLPPLSEVVTAFVDIVRSGRLAMLAVSLQSLATGFGLALVLGIPLGVLMARSAALRYLVGPYVNLMLSLPTSALVPVFMIVFGLGAETRVVVIFVYSFFIIVVNAEAGARGTDPAYLEMARSFGASERDILRRIVLPSALPLLLAGVRVGIGRAVRGMVNGEAIIAVVGIGALVIRYGRSFQMDYLYAVILVIVGLSLAANGLVQVFERRALRWQSRGSS